MNSDKARKYCIMLAAAVLVTCIVIGQAGVPGSEKAVGAAVLAAALILWVSEALPMSITTMLMICVLALANIMTFHEAIANIGVNTSLFIMASSGITVAVGSSGIPRLLTRRIVRSTGGHSKRMVVALGFLIAACSAFMSSLATCALFYGILFPMLKEMKCKPGRSNLGRCMMIIIPACAGIGGFMSPAGTPANILLLDLLDAHNIHISFGQWCMIGFPTGLIAVALFSASLVLLFPPEKLNTDCPDFSGETEGFTLNDKKTLLVVLAVIALWFVSGWVKSLNTTMIAVIGLTVMFLPGMELLDWKKFSGEVNWDLVLTMGTVSVLMTGISKTGIMSSISTAALGSVSGLPVFLSMFLISLTVCLIRAFVPTTTAVVALLAPMLIGISSEMSFPLINLMFILGFWTASALLIVYTEPIYLITFGSGYYQGKDLLKAGIIPCLLLSAITALLIPLIAQLII